MISLIRSCIQPPTETFGARVVAQHPDHDGLQVSVAEDTP
jgi:hypothetical protein